MPLRVLYSADMGRGEAGPFDVCSGVPARWLYLRRQDGEAGCSGAQEVSERVVPCGQRNGQSLLAEQTREAAA